MVSASKHSWEHDLADDELLRITRNEGDPERRRAAATELVMRYRDAVYQWCYRYTRDRERALDLSQDVLAMVWQRMGSFEGRARFSSWLYAVTRNRCIDASRRVSPLAADVEMDDLPDPVTIADVDSEVALTDGWLLRTIRNDLSPDEQQAIWLRCVERMSIDEVTRILRLDTASGARAVLQRARRKIRAALDRERRRI